MDKQTITISEDVINAVVKPMSLFLNDIPKGAIFTHKATPFTSANGVTHYEGEEKDGILFLPSFQFHCNKGGVYKFTTYDLKNFSCGGKSFSEVFHTQANKACKMNAVFTTASASKPALDANGEKVYANLFYKNYDAFMSEKSKLAKGVYPSDEMYAELKRDGIKANCIDKYYRTVDVDKHVFFYDK